MADLHENLVHVLLVSKVLSSQKPAEDGSIRTSFTFEL